MHELVAIDFRNVDRHLGLGRPGGCKGKDGYQGDADPLPWHKTLLSRNRNFSKTSLVPFLSTAWKTTCGCQYSGARVARHPCHEDNSAPAYHGLSKNQRLTELCCKTDARCSCGANRGEYNHANRNGAWPLARNQISCALRLVATAAEGRGRVDGKSEKYRLGYLRSRVCDLAFWLFEHRPRRSILFGRGAAVVGF